MHDVDAARERIAALMKDVGLAPVSIKTLTITRVTRVFLRPRLGDTNTRLPLALYCDAKPTVVAVRRPTIR